MRGLRRLAIVAAVALCTTLAPGVAQADPGDIGVEGPSYAGSFSDPSGSKPESKLWWNDGWWWGSLFDTVSRDFHIFRLDSATQTWVDTGVALDDRSNSRADTLWDGTHLYVASHIFDLTPGAGDGGRLYRFSYDAATDTFSPDPGFPVAINNVTTEALVIDKDSTGTLWATWTQDNLVYVNHTVGGDQTWGTPFVPAVSGTSVNADDISSVIAFGGNKIGLMWSNQATSAMYFAVHADGQPDTTWQASRTALQGPKEADDHINLKSIQSDGSGRVYAAVKSSQTLGSAPLIRLLVRDPATGNWTSYVFGRVSDHHTRPIVMLDEEHRVIHMFATGPTAADPNGTVAIYQKTTPMDNISFATGSGTPVIMDADVPTMDNVTSSKQNVNSTTGLVVLAGNTTTDRYWFNTIALGTPPPTAGFTAAPASGPLPLAVNFTDTSIGAPTSWQWSFGDGATSNLRNPSHTYTSAGLYTVSLSVANAGGTDSETRSNLISAGIQSTFTPVADAYVKSSTPDTNFGKAKNIRVHSAPTTRSYLKFDVTGVSGTVVAARLRLRVTNTSPQGGTAYPVANNTWTETGITWNNAPALGSTPVGNVGAVPAVGTWVEVAVTGAVTGNGTWTLALADGGTDLAYYDSRETANDPQLILTSSTGPVASFTASPTSGTAPLPVAFTDTSTGSPTSWSWTFGDGTTSTLRNPTHTYAAAGTYSVSLTASNTSGSNTTTRTNLITVTTPVAASFTATPTSGTAPLPVAFTDTSTGSPTSWSWTFGDGTTSTLQHPTHTYAAAGTYTVSLTASKASSSNTTTRTNLIAVTTGVAASFTATPTSGTAPLPVAFTDTSTGSPTSWSWTFGDGTTSTLQHPTHTYATAGTYTVSLTASKTSSSSTTTQVITALPPPPLASFTATPTSGTAPLPVTFSDTSAGSPTSWSWTFGDGTTSTLQHPTHTYATAGTYTVSLTATNGGGSNTTTRTNLITVTTGVAANFTATPTSGTAPLRWPSPTRPPDRPRRGPGPSGTAPPRPNSTPPTPTPPPAPTPCPSRPRRPRAPAPRPR